jgi:hypothetical protein
MLPLTLAPPAPFPPVVAQSAFREFVAPGLTLVTYHVATTRGLLVVRALDAEPADGALRVEAVLAHDALISPGETVSSMAQRTGAVAGINADYFDIGQTNQPLNIVVRDGALERTPSGRAVFSIARDGSARIGTYRWHGDVTDAGRTWNLEGVDEWPPQGAGAMLILAAFGPMPPVARGVVLVALAPAPQALRTGGSDVRVAAVATDRAPCEHCAMLAFGVRAADAGPLPVQGDTVHLDAVADPALDGVTTAVGGGPQLVRGGVPYDDPDPPSPAEALQRDPQAGVLIERTGAFAFVQVDGRARDESVGLTRPEFGALLRGLGANDAMAFDSGGSVSLAVRAPGEDRAALRSVPSDGRERRVADGLFFYADGPAGPAARLAVRPADISLLVGATVTLSAVATDATGRPVPGPAGPLRVAIDPPALARAGAEATVTALAAGTGTLRLRRGDLTAEAPIRVVADAAGLRIEPRDAEVAPGGTAAFRAAGADLAGSPLLLGGLVRWSARDGAVTPDGVFRAGSSDGTIVARAGGRQAEAIVRVGTTDAALPIFAPPAAWTFATYPAGGQGSAALVPGEGHAPVLELAYAFLGGVRAAYANTTVPLPGRPLRLSVDVRSDGNGAGVRAALTNADGDRIAVTLAKRADWRGWQRCSVTLPADASAPLALRALYAVATLAGQPAASAGVIAFRDLRVTFAGTQEGRKR